MLAETARRDRHPATDTTDTFAIATATDTIALSPIEPSHYGLTTAQRVHYSRLRALRRDGHGRDARHNRCPAAAMRRVPLDMWRLLACLRAHTTQTSIISAGQASSVRQRRLGDAVLGETSRRAAVLHHWACRACAGRSPSAPPAATALAAFSFVAFVAFAFLYVTCFHSLAMRIAIAIYDSVFCCVRSPRIRSTISEIQTTQIKKHLPSPHRPILSLYFFSPRNKLALIHVVCLGARRRVLSTHAFGASTLLPDA